MTHASITWKYEEQTKKIYGGDQYKTWVWVLYCGELPVIAEYPNDYLVTYTYGDTDSQPEEE